jgi:type VI protein secretion system component Hcp
MPLLMKFPGITGEGTVQDHVGWLALLRFNWGGTRTLRTQVTASHRNATRIMPPQLRSASVQRKSDSQSALLWLNMVNATEVPKITLEWLRTGTAAPVCYFSVELANVRISRIAEDSTGDHPIETLTLLYRSVTLGVRDVGNALTGAQDMVTYSVPQHAGG